MTIDRNRQFNFLPSLLIFKDNLSVIATIFSCKDNLGPPVGHMLRYEKQGKDFVKKRVVKNISCVYARMLIQLIQSFPGLLNREFVTWVT